MTKAAHELEIFRQFAEAVGLAVGLDSICSQSPPLPDISCEIDGQPRYFELTRVADQSISNDVGNLLKEARKTGVGGVGEAHVYDDRAMLRDTVERKAAAKHETKGDRFDLLLYYDGVFHAVTTFRHIEATFRELQARYSGRWAAIWLYDRSSRRFLGPTS